jgi:hydrogenase nickel incorporation protein HypA/HybF
VRRDVHEYSIVQALLERVDAEADRRGATTVHRISIRIGELSGVDVGLLRTAYTLVRDRTRCAQAELDIDSVTAAWQCPACRRAISPGDFLRCSDCARAAELVTGGEILLDRIEMEVP